MRGMMEPQVIYTQLLKNQNLRILCTILRGKVFFLKSNFFRAIDKILKNCFEMA